LDSVIKQIGYLFGSYVTSLKNNNHSTTRPTIQITELQAPNDTYLHCPWKKYKNRSRKFIKSPLQIYLMRWHAKLCQHR